MVSFLLLFLLSDVSDSGKEEGMIFLNIINIGIVAHVDAGKTTLTENLLYLGGAIKEIGRVDLGNTITDSMELERKRGITIRASAVSFNWKNVKINILDTPGHADFVSEVERSLSILDGAILVVSAVEGIQAHTVMLFNTLKALKIPTMIFVNKLDRAGAQNKKLIDEMKRTLSQKITPLQEVFNEGSSDVSVSELYSEKIKDAILDTLCNIDDNMLMKYVEGKFITKSEIKRKVELSSRLYKFYPVLYGSALKGLGVTMLLDSIIGLLPFSKGQIQKPLSAVVFKIDAEDAKDKKVYIRLFDGKISTRDSISIMDTASFEKVKRINIPINGRFEEAPFVLAGDIGVLYGLKNIKIGDIIGVACPGIRTAKIAEPTLKTKISPINKGDNCKLYEILSILAEEDPLLCLEIGDLKDDIYINLFGEVQMEIIQEIIESKYGIKVIFSEVLTIYKETPENCGEAVIHLNEHGNPFRAGVGVRIEPLPLGVGIKFSSKVSLGDLSRTFQNAVEEAVYDTLKQGLLGWEVTDILVSFISSDYDSVTSTPSAFRNLTPMVLMEALNMSKTELLEPLYEFQLKANKEVCGKALSDLQRLRAVFDTPLINGDEIFVQGLIPVDTSKKYKIQIASFTEGKGVFVTKFHSFQKIPIKLGKMKDKTKIDPLNKIMYILYKSNAIIQ